MKRFDRRPPMCGWPHDAVFCTRCDTPLPNCWCGHWVDGIEHNDEPGGVGPGSWDAV